MTLRELHEAAVQNARPGGRGENEWFIWWYRAQRARTLSTHQGE